MKVWLGGVALVAALGAFAGCSKQDAPLRYNVSGAVTLDGQPIPYGEVLFTPDAAKNHSGPQGIAPIRDGRYDTGASGGKGVAGGPTVVRVTGFASEGGKLLCDVELPAELPRADGTYNDVSMGSNHSQGCNVVFGDGSVRFLNETIDLNTVLKPLASRAGGEVIPNF